MRFDWRGQTFQKFLIVVIVLSMPFRPESDHRSSICIEQHNADALPLCQVSIPLTQCFGMRSFSLDCAATSHSLHTEPWDQPHSTTQSDCKHGIKAHLLILDIMIASYVPYASWRTH